jgi:uncharacterized membrane protein
MHGSARTLAKSVSIVFLGFGLWHASAEAQSFQRNVKFCNHGREALNVAAGFDRAGTSESTSKGWTIVQPCTCRTVISGSLRATEVFLYASRNGTMQPVLNGRGPLCINSQQRFAFVAQNRNQQACAAAGGKWVNFRFHDTGTQQNSTVTFRQPNSCNL